MIALWHSPSLCVTWMSPWAWTIGGYDGAWACGYQRETCGWWLLTYVRALGIEVSWARWVRP